MSSISSAAGRPQLVVVLCLVLCLTTCSAAAERQADSLESWIDKAGALVPRTPGDCRDTKRVEAIEQACRAIDTWALRIGTVPADTGTDELLRRVERLLAGKVRVDRVRDDLFAMRKEFVREADSEPRRVALGNYLRAF